MHLASQDTTGCVNALSAVCSALATLAAAMFVPPMGPPPEPAPGTTRPPPHRVAIAVDAGAPPPAPSVTSVPRGGRPTYADRLRADLATATDPADRARLAGRILRARSIASRLLPIQTPLRSGFQERFDAVRTVWVRGVARQPYSGVRALLRDFCPDLLPESLLAVGFAGPLTEFVVTTPEAAAALTRAFGSSVLSSHQPELPLRSELRSDPQSVQAAQQAYVARMARAIRGTNNLLLATYLQRRVPALASAIGTAVGLRSRPSSVTPPSGPRATGEE